MGRPKSENKLTNAEKKRCWRDKHGEEEKEKARIKYHETKEKMNEEELMMLREKNRIKKAMSRANRSRQKVQGQKLKGKNRKRRGNDNSEVNTSTPRVQKHREQIKVKMNFPKKLSRKGKYIKKKVIDEFSEIDSSEKKKILTSVIQMQSPKSQKELKENISIDTTHTPRKEILETLNKKRDKLSNCARKIIQKSKAKTSKTSTYRSLLKAHNHSIDEIIKIYKAKQVRKRVPDDHIQTVIEFYNSDVISRVLPYKNLTVLVKDKSGVKQRVPVRVMEKTLDKAFMLFKEKNPDIVIGRSKFESLRPKNIRLKKAAKRLVCGCSKHMNVEYVKRVLMGLLVNNNLDASFTKSNEKLCEFLLCDTDNINCIMGYCKQCGKFPLIDKLDIHNLKCSKDCFRDQADCADLKHTIKVQQFEYIKYLHKGIEKKKVGLADKYLQLDEFSTLLKKVLTDFPRHRYSITHSDNTIEQLKENITEENIIKVQDFSENYTCLLPDEIQSLHWHYTVYPVVVIRKVEGRIREDNFVFVSDDMKHDVPFVEKCNEMIHQHYAKENIQISHDIEINDGCAAQYKSITAFSAFARREMQTTRIYFESAHGKSKSDGLGGVIKAHVSMAVAGERVIIRDAKEFFEYCQENLTIINCEEDKLMLNRVFYFISKEEMELYRETFPKHLHKTVAGTRSFHQIANKPGYMNGIFTKVFSCACYSCLNGSNHCDCVDGSKFKEKPLLLKYLWRGFVDKGGNDVDEADDVDFDLETGDELESEEYIERDAGKMIFKDDIAVINSGDDVFTYYLMVLNEDPFETKKVTTDDYRHTLPPNHRVIKGNYLELHRDNKDGFLYYVEKKKEAIVSSLCVIGICPPLTTKLVRRKGKDENMYFVDNELHQSLIELEKSDVII